METGGPIGAVRGRYGLKMMKEPLSIIIVDGRDT